MARRLNVRRLLRKHRNECVEGLEYIQSGDPPYDHNTEQLIVSYKNDIKMIDCIVHTFYKTNKGRE